MATSPVPKWCCQIRLASTRARSAAGREPGLVSQRARASRRPVELEPANGGFGSYRLSGSVKKARTPGPTLGPGVARLPRIRSGISDGLFDTSPTHAIRPGFGHRWASAASITRLSASFLLCGVRPEREVSLECFDLGVDHLLMDLPAHHFVREAPQSTIRSFGLTQCSTLKAG